MKKFLYRALSFLMIFILLASSTAFSFAVNPVVEYVAGTFFDALAGELVSNGVDYIKDCIGYSAGKVCNSSPDGYHHSHGPGFSGALRGTDDNGRYVYVPCLYCGEYFKFYSSGGFERPSDLQQSYEAQVAELPATVYQSTGSLRWSPKFLGFAVEGFLGDVVCPHFSYDKNMKNSITHQTISFDCVNNTVSFRLSSSSHEDLIMGYPYSQWDDFYPIDGYYRRIDSVGVDGYYLDKSSKSHSVKLRYSKENSATYHSVKSKCSSGFRFSYMTNSSSKAYLSFCSIHFYSPIYEITPLDSLIGEVNTTYNINSRPTSITGDYGIIGDNGQIIKVEGDKIVNETNNTYYNPATGTTDTITDWSYNYEDRSYTLTLGGGTTTTVTYGDENVTIKEGDTTYNIYYLVEGSGEDPDPGPGPDVPIDCDHTWTETSRTEPTCTTPGKVISTCSKCNQSKTETIPATGHSWVVDRTVQTTYDEEGNLLQQGYTIYSCSVCGEQYKDMEGTGPPADDDPGDGGIIEFLDGLIKSLSKNLHGAVELILSFFQEIPAMFDGFLAFLTAMFPFLPPEIMTLLAFGIAAVVFIGIIKALRR